MRKVVVTATRVRVEHIRQVSVDNLYFDPRPPPSVSHTAHDSPWVQSRGGARRDNKKAQVNVVDRPWPIKPHQLAGWSVKSPINMALLRAWRGHWRGCYCSLIFVLILTWFSSSPSSSSSLVWVLLTPERSWVEGEADEEKEKQGR